MLKRLAAVLAMVSILSFGVCACNDDSDGDDKVAPEKTFDQAEFAARAVEDYLGLDYAVPWLYAADGTTDADGDGGIDINDAAIIIETLKNLGFDVPETTLNGLYENYYTEAGYSVQDEMQYAKNDFAFTKSHTIGEAELKAGEFAALEPGDLIFTDFDMNFTWDNAAIYLGAYEDKTHAVVLAFDDGGAGAVQVLDLADAQGYFWMDIQYGYCDVRKLNKSAIEGGGPA